MKVAAVIFTFLIVGTSTATEANKLPPHTFQQPPMTKTKCEGMAAMARTTMFQYQAGKSTAELLSRARSVLQEDLIFEASEFGRTRDLRLQEMFINAFSDKILISCYSELVK